MGAQEVGQLIGGFLVRKMSRLRDLQVSDGDVGVSDILAVGIAGNAPVRSPRIDHTGTVIVPSNASLADEEGRRAAFCVSRAALVAVLLWKEAA